MRQQQISEYRILRAFKSTRSNLTTQQVCEKSGLKRATVSPCLNELVTSQRLAFTIENDGKTKRYTLRDLRTVRPLRIYGSRKKKQVMRLRKLGLKPLRDYLWIKTSRRRGRPKKPLGYEDSFKLMDRLWDLGTATRHVAKSTPEIDLDDREIDGDRGLDYGIPGDQRQELMKRLNESIPKARDHLATLQRARSAGKGPKDLEADAIEREKAQKQRR